MRSLRGRPLKIPKSKGEWSWPIIKRAGFYLNAEEKAVLDRRVAEAGMNRSEYIRHMIRTSNLKPYPEGFLKKVKEEIKVFGDEINEIVKAVNSRGFVKDEEIHRIIELEKELLVVLKEDLHQGP